MKAIIKELKDSVYGIHNRAAWIQEDCHIDDNAYNMAQWCWEETILMERNLKELEDSLFRKAARRKKAKE